MELVCILFLCDLHCYNIIKIIVVCLASSPGPLSQLFNFARKKARGGPGMRHHAHDAKGRFKVESI